MTFFSKKNPTNKHILYKFQLSQIFKNFFKNIYSLVLEFKIHNVNILYVI